MNILRIAAFADGDRGGNPAGVVVEDQMPSAEDMRRIAAEVGYSETAFAAPEKDNWRVRYFSPESEVPFCGHATIALGAALARKLGNADYQLQLNNAKISVTGHSDGNSMSAALQSPPTRSKAIEPELLTRTLSLFGLSDQKLNLLIPPAHIHGGADHIIFVLRSREALADMKYNLDEGRHLMNEAGLITIMLVYAETPQLFHARNAFASGGVYEDPATGASSAAFAGYLRDINWPHQGMIDIVQGEDMGMRSLIKAEFSNEIGSSIRVSGAARFI